MELIELANRLCLPQFLAFVEQSIVSELTTAEKSDQNITEEVLMYLEPAQAYKFTFSIFVVKFLVSHFVLLHTFV